MEPEPKNTPALTRPVDIWWRWKGNSVEKRQSFQEMVLELLDTQMQETHKNQNK